MGYNQDKPGLQKKTTYLLSTKRPVKRKKRESGGYNDTWHTIKRG